MITFLNYLDGIAIGIEQNLYIELLAHDHIALILKTHVEKALVGTELEQFKIDPAGYERLVKLYKKWTNAPTAFKAR